MAVLWLLKEFPAFSIHLAHQSSSFVLANYRTEKKEPKELFQTLWWARESCARRRQTIFKHQIAVFHFLFLISFSSSFSVYIFGCFFFISSSRADLKINTPREWARNTKIQRNTRLWGFLFQTWWWWLDGGKGGKSLFPPPSPSHQQQEKL